MTHPLDHCYLKLDRADEHLETIKGEIQRFLARNPYRVVGKLYLESPKKLRYAAIAEVCEEPPKSLGILISEFLHNMRSSLDHLAYVLATPPSGGDAPDGTEFPIFKDRSLFFATIQKGTRRGQPARGSGLYKMRGMPREPQTMIKWLQPYRRINDPKRNLLWRLHDLNIGDKHRRHHLTGAVMEGSDLGIVPPVKDVNLHFHGWSNRIQSGAFKNGATVGSFSVAVTGPNPQVHVDADFAFDVAFDPKGVARGAPVVSTLTEIRDHVRNNVFPKLEKFV